MKPDKQKEVIVGTHRSEEGGPNMTFVRAIQAGITPEDNDSAVIAYMLDIAHRSYNQITVGTLVLALETLHFKTDRFEHLIKTLRHIHGDRENQLQADRLADALQVYQSKTERET